MQMNHYFGVDKGLSINNLDIFHPFAFYRKRIIV